ncbi:MAG: leader peptidase (prepilin peptidase) / N-methyltransferase [Solirubrobacteraceae bacterium]|jgi:prepilin signal peptidase PulO-like enzyme (type II secretory pathway)|nr:leader peptidase (prepilin peptidase) / N-methyltransferase [Solirubrobacteraceae bacterium]
MSELTLPAASNAGGPEVRLLRRPVTVAPAVVAVVALAFAILPLGHAVVAAITGATLVVLSAIDLESGIIPNRVVLPAAGIVLCAQVALFPDRAAEWALAAILSAFVLMLPQLIGRGWMGMGDVKLGLLLGAALGWAVLGAVVLAFVCVFPVALLVLLRGGIAARKTMIPFGPFLALGALIILFGPQLAGITS